jgi:hypothetical protein
MADLTLRVNGENNAGPALKEAAGGVSNLSNEVAVGAAKWSLLSKSISVATDFLKESFKASQEQARADRQLARVAGESTEAFKRQASALQESLGVSDDMVQTMQKMLLQYGQAPAEVGKTVRAILDLSAATGQDAVSAVSQLTGAVTGGRTAFRELGIEYDKTGTKSHVLESVTAALTKKFGGAADIEGQSLNGSLNKAKQQFGELQETFGALVGSFLEKTKVIESATWAFKQLNEAINPGANERKRESSDRLMAAQKELDLYVKQEAAGQRISMQGQARMDILRKTIEMESKAWADANREAAAADMPLATTGSADKEKAAGGREAVVKAKSEKDIHMFREAQRAMAAEIEKTNSMKVDMGKSFIDENEKLYEDAEKKRIAAFSDAKEEEMRLMVKGLNEQAAIIKKQDDQWAAAGAAIGGAFAGALSNAIADLASGGEADVGETIGSILASVLAVAGSVLGNIVAPGVGGAIGGALGGLAGAGIKAATRRPRHHSGGYIDSGDVGTDEQSAILQTHEYVLNRQQVHNMGGPRGVEAAARGSGGGMTINVSTFDGSTAREYFEKQGGRALQNTLRTGRGVLPGLLGGR